MKSACSSSVTADTYTLSAAIGEASAKLIFKCALLLSVVGGLLYAGGAACRQTNAYRDLEREEGTGMFRSMPESIGVAVFGTSHGREDFKSPPEGRAFSISPWPRRRLYTICGSCGSARAASVPARWGSPPSAPCPPFCEPPDGQLEEQQPRYYRILSPWNIVDVDLGRSLRGRSSPGSMARSIWTIPGTRSLPGAATLTGTWAIWTWSGRRGPTA